jgi:hypothetical protein
MACERVRRDCERRDAGHDSSTFTHRWHSARCRRAGLFRRSPVAPRARLPSAEMPVGSVSFASGQSRGRRLCEVGIERSCGNVTSTTAETNLLGGSARLLSRRVTCHHDRTHAPLVIAPPPPSRAMRRRHPPQHKSQRISSSMARLASASTRSLPGIPEWPLTQCHSNEC